MSSDPSTNATGRSAGLPEGACMDRCPGHRVKIIGRVIRIAPLPDASHARTLTDLTLAFVVSSRTAPGRRCFRPSASGYPPVRRTSPSRTWRSSTPIPKTTWPDSIGAEVKLDVSAVLRAGEPEKAT